jgi:hypothetical protein
VSPISPLACVRRTRSSRSRRASARAFGRRCVTACQRRFKFKASSRPPTLTPADPAGGAAVREPGLATLRLPASHCATAAGRHCRAPAWSHWPGTSLPAEAPSPRRGPGLAAGSGGWTGPRPISEPPSRYLLVLQKISTVLVGISKKYLHDSDIQYLQLDVGMSLSVGICQYQ